MLKKKHSDKIMSHTIDPIRIKKINYNLIYRVIIWQISKKKKNKSHVKEKSEINKSTRKIYKQKGTGKARHGSLKANQFRGGGVVFGPNKYRNRNLKMNKKIRKKALINAIALKYKERKIIIYNEINLSKKNVKSFMGNMEISLKKNIEYYL